MKIMKVLTADEQNRLIEAAKGDPDGDLFILMLATGLRIGEATALTWSDIDFEASALTVNKAVSHRLTHIETGATITKSSRKNIQLTPSVLEMLNKKERIPNDMGLIFPSVSGDLLSRDTVRDRLKKLLLKANIDGRVTPHTLRNTYVIRGSENGIELEAMQEPLGCASIRITSDV